MSPCFDKAVVRPHLLVSLKTLCTRGRRKSASIRITRAKLEDYKEKYETVKARLAQLQK